MIIEADMKKSKFGCLMALLFGVVVAVMMYLPVWVDDFEARSNKEEVLRLVHVGQDISEAEAILKENDFRLYHDEPITPTYDESYLQQLVIVGNTQPSFFESISYATGIWMPFTSGESPYLIINADLDGVITEID